MLVQLHISNYAIISKVEILFDGKLNIITGETGAGKSILIGALGLVLGDRADTKVLMSATDKCVVEGVFHIKNYNLQIYFENNELDYSDTCYMRREINTAGKSRAFINDTPVNLSQLKELGSQLIEIVSQHETLELNETHFQLSIIDAIAETEKFLLEYKKLFSAYKSNEKKIKELIEREQKSRQDEDYFRFQLNELEEANIAENEQEKLESTLDILSNAGIIQEATGNAFRELEANENSLINQIEGIKTLLLPSAKHHPELNDLLKRMESTIVELKDVSAELESISEKTESSPEELSKIESRLQLLFDLKKKHRVKTDLELIELKEKIVRDLKGLESLQNEIENAEKEISNQKSELTNLANSLSAKRSKAIPTIEKNINSLLKQVEMPDAKIKIDQQVLNEFTENGMDKIQILVSTNTGSPFLPLNKIASGGELSRLMLCIKSLISDKTALPTIIFDEIDSGISGEAALKVSQVMKKHSFKHQVIAITHLPQIAGKADAHFYVYKTNDKTSTQTRIKKLNDNEHLEEIARMLHGENPSLKVIEAAKELISN